MAVRTWRLRTTNSVCRLGGTRHHRAIDRIRGREGLLANEGACCLQSESGASREIACLKAGLDIKKETALGGRL